MEVTLSSVALPALSGFLRLAGGLLDARGMRLHRSLFLTSGLFLGLGGGFLACGGDDTTSNPADGGGSDATIDGGGGSDTSTGQDTGTSDGSGGDTGTGGDAGGDAALDVQLIPDTGNTLTDSGPGGDAAILNCGTAQCNLPTQTCCVYPESPNFYVACSTGAACPLLDAGTDSGISAVALQCEDKENCGGNLVCCLYSTNDGGSIQSHCTDSCVGGEKHAILCDQGAADAGCGDAGACSSANISTWNLPTGFATCGGVLR